MKLAEEQYKQACRDYVHGYTMAARYVFDYEEFARCNHVGKRFCAAELKELIWDDELETVFGELTKHMRLGIEECLYNIESMQYPQNITSVRLS